MKIRYLLVLIYERLHWLCFYLPVFLTKQVNKLVRTKIRLQGVSLCVIILFFENFNIIIYFVRTRIRLNVLLDNMQTD